MPPVILLRIFNVDAKYTVHDGGSWAFGVGAALFSLNPDNYDIDTGSDEPIVMVPLRATGSYTHESLSFHLGVSYCKVSGEANAIFEEDETGGSEMAVEGVAAVSTAALHPAVEWRLGPVFALVAEANIKLYAAASGDANETLVLEGGRLTIEAYQAADASLSEGARANVVLSGFWSWPHFNLKTGLLYGHYNLPMVNFFMDERIVFPELDLYWRF